MTDIILKLSLIDLFCGLVDKEKDEKYLCIYYTLRERTVLS